jgi:ankyrin repeat protein
MDNINKQLIENIKLNNIDEVITLLDQGANVNYEPDIIDADIGTPLYIAVTMNHYQIAKILLNRGADINYGRGYLLYRACSNGNGGMIELLLNEGINYNKEHLGSLIGFCIHNDNVNDLKLLIQHDIINVIDEQYYDIFWQKKSAWKTCIENKAKNILEFIIENYPEIIQYDNIHIREEDINKYNFIKMLINRNLIDIAD